MHKSGNGPDVELGIPTECCDCFHHGDRHWVKLSRGSLTDLFNEFCNEDSEADSSTRWVHLTVLHQMMWHSGMRWGDRWETVKRSWSVLCTIQELSWWNGLKFLWNSGYRFEPGTCRIIISICVLLQNMHSHQPIYATHPRFSLRILTKFCSQSTC